LGYPLVTREIIADSEAKGLATEFFGGSDIEGFGAGMGVDGLGISGGGFHPVALGALRSGGLVAGKIRDARDYNFAAIGFIDVVAEAAADGANEGHLREEMCDGSLLD
jgi:hypothetical protein